MANITYTVGYKLGLAKSLNYISLSGETTEWSVGDTFAFDGTVTVGYLDGTTEVLSSGYVVDSSGVDMSAAGTYTVTVSYTDPIYGNTESDSYTITVQQPVPALITDRISCTDLAAMLPNNSSYQFWSLTGTSGAKYNGMTAKNGSGDIQYRVSTSACGIAMTLPATSGIPVAVNIKWTARTSTTQDRSISVYGSMSPYESAIPGYMGETTGTLIGTIQYGKDPSVVHTLSVGGYPYLYFQGGGGAQYIDYIEIVYSTQLTPASIPSKKTDTRNWYATLNYPSTDILPIVYPITLLNGCVISWNDTGMQYVSASGAIKTSAGVTSQFTITAPTGYKIDSVLFAQNINKLTYNGVALTSTYQRIAVNNTVTGTFEFVAATSTSAASYQVGTEITLSPIT